MKFRLAAASLTVSTTALLASCAQQLARPAPAPSTLPPAQIAPAPKPELAPAAPIGSEMQIALLLASRGPYAGPAEMVRDGFLAALYAQTGTRPTVRIYDAGSSADSVHQAIRRAVSDGASFVVGPLQKDLVAATASQGTPPVPMLALNYLEPNQSAPGNFYELGLAPEDEARAAAEQAVAGGLRRAAALTPSDNWGERILAAFSRRMQELGGEIVTAQRYAGVADLSQPIRALMGIPESEERKNAVAAVLGKVEYEPRRRNDLDFVFVAAHAEQGRLIIPQLRFNRLGNLPVFATAQVFDSGTGDADLSGLRSCDMPMTLGAGGRYAGLRLQLNETLPGRTREQQRLFALGFDAYQLIGFLRAGPLPSGGGFPAATGDLGMGANGAITRTLTCGTLVRATL